MLQILREIGFHVQYYCTLDVWLFVHLSKFGRNPSPDDLAVYSALKNERKRKPNGYWVNRFSILNIEPTHSSHILRTKEKTELILILGKNPSSIESTNQPNPQHFEWIVKLFCTIWKLRTLDSGWFCSVFTMTCVCSVPHPNLPATVS